jgi:general secretion pathway protein D
MIGQKIAQKTVQTVPAAPAEAASQSAPAATGTTAPGHITRSDQRRAAKEYLDASKLFIAGQFEQARQRYQRAAALDPSNPDYRQAAGIALDHEVTELVQEAAKDRLRGDASGARAALLRAYKLAPTNFEVAEHLDQLGEDVARAQPSPLYAQADAAIGGAVQLKHTSDLHSFHLRGDEHAVIEEVFKAYGIEAMVDQSVGGLQVRFDIGDADFAEAVHALGMLTDSFFVPIDDHRVIAARDNPNNRERFMRQDLETFYVPGLSKDTMTEVTSLAREVFQAQRVAADSSADSITLRAPQPDLEAFNSTMHELLDGSSQVVLDVRMMQVAHTSNRNTGVQPPQSITAFNVYAEEQSILNANQSLVQQIISSGLAAPGDTLAILGILLASGEVSSSLFSNGLALFGGGLTQSALAPGSITANFNLNSADTREIDNLQLRLGDGQDGTLKLGTRYPIETSQYSNLSSSLPSIPGLSGAGSSSNLSSLLSELGSAVPPIPQVQYQDIGLTLKVTPRVLRNGNIALSIALTLDGLAGSSLNGLPILNNQSYEGVVMVRQGAAAVLAGNLDQSESRAITGTPGISEIPGMASLTGNDFQKNYSTLLIVITPHLVRGTQNAGHSPMFRVVGTAPQP